MAPDTDSGLATVEIVLGVLGFFQFVFNVIMGFILRRLSQDRHELNVLKSKVEKGDEKAHDLTTKLVDERLRAATHELNNQMQGLVSAVADFRDKLRDGDAEIGTLQEKHHANELKIVQDIAKLQNYVVEHAASKEDMRENQRAWKGEIEGLRRQLTKAGGGPG
jgi:DNA repair exonuclease SbcCD ATPase subunit